MSMVRTLRRWRAAMAVALLASLLATASPAAAAAHPAFPRLAFELTLLHHSDGESQLLGAPGQPEFGNVARFGALADRLRAEGRWSLGEPLLPRQGAVLVSSGDNFLAGPEFNASLEKGVPFYDAIALDAIGYDAITIGNHEFDFGPDVLADFIESFDGPVPFLSANLDVTAEPRLAALAAEGRLTSSTVVKEHGRRIGVIGLTTPTLPSISSPRGVVVRTELAEIVNAEVDALESEGVNIIILSSHLQGIGEEVALVSALSGVDIVVAGGGGELLANPGDLLVPGDEDAVFGAYPQQALDADGRRVPVVATTGDYKYIGRLQATFNPRGRLVAVGEGSGAVRVSGVAPDAVAPDPFIQGQVVEPVAASVAELAETVIGTTEVGLDGTRSAVRTRETNLGNLVADALLAEATEQAPAFGAPVPDVALQNGGGIRNDSIIGPGELTELDTFDILPFSNFVSVVPAVPRDVFKALLENAVAEVAVVGGRFAQIAGFSFTYDPAAVVGSRVVAATLDDGTSIVAGGAVVEGAPLNVATIDFLAGGGDEYPFGDLPFTTLGTSYQQALLDFIVEDLGGLVTAADYPEGGEGRISTIGS